MKIKTENIQSKYIVGSKQNGRVSNKDSFILATGLLSLPESECFYPEEIRFGDSCTILELNKYKYIQTKGGR